MCYKNKKVNSYNPIEKEKPQLVLGMNQIRNQKDSAGLPNQQVSVSFYVEMTPTKEEGD